MHWLATSARCCCKTTTHYFPVRYQFTCKLRVSESRVPFVRFARFNWIFCNYSVSCSCNSVFFVRFCFFSFSEKTERENVANGNLNKQNIVEIKKMQLKNGFCWFSHAFACSQFNHFNLHWTRTRLACTKKNPIRQLLQRILINSMFSNDLHRVISRSPFNCRMIFSQFWAQRKVDCTTHSTWRSVHRASIITLLKTRQLAVCIPCTLFVESH